MHAVNEFGRRVPCIDEGFLDSPIFVYLDSHGPVGIVRAQSWEGAWEVVQDCFLPDADPADPDTYARSYDETADPTDLAEGIGFRPNGVPCTDPDTNPRGLQSHMYAEDLNGSQLNGCTVDSLASDYGITLHLPASDNGD